MVNEYICILSPFKLGMTHIPFPSNPFIACNTGRNINICRHPITRRRTFSHHSIYVRIHRPIKEQLMKQQNCYVHF